MRALSFSLSLCLCAPPLLGPSVAFAAPEEQAPALEVDVDPALKDAELIQAKLVEEGERTLAIASSARTEDGRIRLTVGGKDFDYTLRVDVERSGSVIETELEPVQCSPCTKTQLVSQSLALLGEAVNAMEATAPNENASTSSEEDSDPEQQPFQAEVNPRPLPEDDDRARIGPLGKAGIGVLVVGALAVAGGLPMVIIGEEVSSSTREAVDEIDLRPGGIALLATGGAALLAGSVMLAIDVSRRNKSKLSLTPTFSPTGAGLSLQGRF